MLLHDHGGGGLVPTQGSQSRCPDTDFVGLRVWGYFCYNFTENGPQNLKIGQKDAPRHSVQYAQKQSGPKLFLGDDQGIP